MATMDLNTWLASAIATGGIGPGTYQPGYEWMDPWQGRTVGSLTDAEKLSLLEGSNFGKTYGQTPQSILAKGSFDYNQPKESGLLEDFSPLLMMAGLAAGAGAFSNGGFGGLFGGAESGIASGGLEGALGGEALGSAGFSGGTGGLGLNIGDAPFAGTTESGGSSLMDMIKATQGNTPYLRTGDIANAAEGGQSTFGLNPNSTAPFSGLNVTQPAVDAFTGPVAESMPTLEGTGAFADMPWGVNPQAGSGGTDPFDTNIWGDGGGALRDLSELPPATNLQDFLTKTDPAYLKTLLNSVPGGASILSKVLEGKATTDDYVKIAGAGGSTILGLLGVNNQSASLEKLASQFAGYGAPYRAQLASISQDPNQFYNSPTGQGALNAVLQKLSVGGNPAGDPYKQALATSSLYDKYSQERGLLGTLGGLSAYNAAAPGMSASAANSSGNMYNVLGYGLGQVTNPPQSLSDLAKAFGINSAA